MGAPNIKGIGMSNRFNKAALLATSIIAGMAIAAPAAAQDDGELIIVTGSRIAKRVNTDTSSPIAVVDAEEFKLSGTVNVENVINSLPQVIPGTTSASNNPGNGVSTLNLRGIGASRTLVLVNGRRWMSYDTSQIVDLNTIPAFLIEGTDVVTGGASAVYGSDALAGVVNFRLKNVEGAELGGQYAITGRGDGERYEVFGALGGEFADGKGHATVYGEYYRRSSIFQDARGFSTYSLGGESFGDNQQKFGSSTLPAGVIRYTGKGSVAGTDFAKNKAVVFDVPGEFRARAGDTYNYAPANYLQIPQERYLIGGFADYEFSEGHKFYTEVAFVNNRVAQELAPTPVTGTFAIDLPTIKSFLSAGDYAQLQQISASENDGTPDTINLYLQRRTVETGSRNSLDERNAFRVLAGVKGDISDNWSYDAYYMFARTRNSNIQQGNISKAAFQAGLNGTAKAINIFGPGTLTPAMVKQISIQAQNSDSSNIQVATASVNGRLGSLGLSGGDVGLAFGGEYRALSSRYIPDTALASGDVIGFNAGEPTAGGYNVKELFAELDVPVLGPDSGIERLDFNFAGRYSDYSVSKTGTVWSYAAGVQFQPIQDITFRANYQRAVRAPNVSELFGGKSIGFPGASDPCAGAAAAAAGKLRDLCIANGVPAGIVGTSAVQLNVQIPVYGGGNPNLSEETSDSYTFGVALQPSFLPGLTATVDYYDIKVKDAIASISLQTSFDLCFNQVQDQNAKECAPFFANGPIRNGAGVIDVETAPSIGVQNVASLREKGIDLQIDYATRMPFSLLTGSGESKLNLGLLGTWRKDSTSLPYAGADVVRCDGKFGSTCGQSTPSFKWAARATWSDGPLTTSINWRHLSAVHDDDPATDYAAFNGVERLNAYDVVDLTFAADVNENINLTFGVRNLFDTLPQTPTIGSDGYVSSTNNGTLLGDNQEQANTFPSTYDTLGRDFFVSARLKF